MSFMYGDTMFNQAKAGKIARQIVAGLAPSDIESLITDRVDQEELDKLYEAVDANYQKYNQSDDNHEMAEDIRRIAWFNIGFHAALELLREEQAARDLMLTRKQYRKMSSEVKAAIK